MSRSMVRGVVARWPRLFGQGFDLECASEKTWQLGGLPFLLGNDNLVKRSKVQRATANQFEGWLGHGAHDVGR